MKNDNKWRQRLVGALAVLTCILLFVSLIGVWVQRTIYDTDRWVALVEDLPSEPAVAQGLADRITEQLVSLTDPQAKISEVLPPQASALAGPITVALENLVSRTVADVIASDQFRSVWVSLNRFAHQKVIAFLDGDSEIIQADDGKVQLNLMPIVGEVLDRLPSGLLGEGSVPDISVDLPMDEARRLISSYLGLRQDAIPEDFGQITIFESDRLETVQRALAAFNNLVVVMVIATLAMGAVTIVLSRRRRRTVVALGIGAAVTVAMAWALLRVIGNQVADSLANESAGKVAGDVFNSLLSDLRSTTTIVLVAGSVAAVVAFLLGDSRPARWTQVQVRAARDVTTAAAMETSQGGSAAAWAAGNEVGLRVGGVVVAVALLLLLDVSWGWLAWVVALLVAWELAISGLVRLARRPALASPHGGDEARSP